jgi:glucosamine-6-phosphate deaminase
MSNLASSTDRPKNIFFVDSLSVRVYNSKRELAKDAAAIAKQYLNSLLSRQHTATVILATGNSQIEFLEALVSVEDLDWSRIIFFHLDEYLGISAGDRASFRRYLRERVEEKINPCEFHYIEGDTLQPLDECSRYGGLLQRQPLDLCCLGIGENGHLAFNEPSVANFNDPYKIKIVKLDLENRQQQVEKGHFLSLETVPEYAFTLTIPTICSAQKILCLAPEKGKAQIVKKMLQNEISTACPASILRQQPQATLFLDTDSASKL